jgi:RNA polymerase sigma-70 factor (ECF subfamily)
MSPDSSSFPQLLSKLRQGDDDAAGRIFDVFARRLVELARQRLNQRLLQKIDPEDVVQSVFGTVFLRLRAGQFEVGGWDSLWGLLTCVTVHKCCKWIDYFGAQGRDPAREVRLDGDDSGAGTGRELFDRKPTPDEAAALADLVEQSLHGLKPQEQEIVGLRLQGESVPEIAPRGGCSESKVNRILRHVGGRLLRLRDRDDRLDHPSH